MIHPSKRITQLLSGILVAALSLHAVGCGGGIKEMQRTAATDSIIYTAVMHDKANGFAVGEVGNVRYTTDGGKTWQKGKNESLCLFAINEISADTCIAGGNGSSIVKTIDGGKTWNHLADLPAKQAKGLAFQTAEKGWAWARGDLYQTIDSGVTWTKIAKPNDVKVIEGAYMADINRGCICGEKGLLYETADGGTTWKESVRIFTSDDPAFKPAIASTNQKTAITFDGNKGIIVSLGTADNKAVFKIMTTRDGGVTWKEQPLFYPEAYPLSINFNRAMQLAAYNIDSTVSMYKIKL